MRLVKNITVNAKKSSKGKSGGNCGIGSGGFQKGNSCARGGGTGSPSTDFSNSKMTKGADGKVFTIPSSKSGMKTIRPPVSKRIQAEAKASVDDHMKKHFNTPKKFPPYQEGKDNGLTAWLSSKEGKAATANKNRMISQAVERAKYYEKYSEYGSMDFEKSKAKYFNARPITDYHTVKKSK